MNLRIQTAPQQISLSAMTSLDRSTGAMLSILRWTSDLVAKVGHGYSGVCILNYHRVLQAADPLFPDDPDLPTFELQMQVLARYFNVISLADAVSDLESRRVKPRSVCITFDDGYRSIHDLALPVLSRLGLPATVFVTSGYIDRGAMWNDRIIEAVRHYNGDRLDLGVASIGVLACATLHSKRAACEALINHAKYLPCEQRERFTEMVESLTDAQPMAHVMMTAPMLNELVRNNIEIGAHTVSHPILTSIDVEDAVLEIEGSKRTLEATISREVRFFAYPNGKMGRDFDDRHVKLVKQAGFMAAFTSSNSGAATPGSSFLMKRCMPWDRDPVVFGMRIFRWLHHH